MTENDESRNEVLVDCSLVPVHFRNALKAYLERQPEILQVKRKLHVTDTLLHSDTLGLVAPSFDLVVVLRKTPEPASPTEIGNAIVGKVARWAVTHGPRASQRE